MVCFHIVAQGYSRPILVYFQTSADDDETIYEKIPFVTPSVRRILFKSNVAFFYQ